MMYTIMGATGQVGSAVASRLLDDGHQVRALARDPARAVALADRGAEVVVAHLDDRAGLTAALRGTQRLFALLPFDPTVADFEDHAARLRAAIAGSVEAAEVPNVTMLSSLGADLAEGTGPIVELHHLEEQLRATGATVCAIRSPHFQEKVVEVLDVVRGQGIYPVFGSADVAMPMVATRDVGDVAARTLVTPPEAHEIVDLDGPASTEREVAAALGRALGRSLEVVEIPRAGWLDAFVQAGFPPHTARVMVGLYEAGARGLLVPRGDRVVHCWTPLEATLASLVGDAAA